LRINGEERGIGFSVKASVRRRKKKKRKERVPPIHQRDEIQMKLTT